MSTTCVIHVRILGIVLTHVHIQNTCPLVHLCHTYNISKSNACLQKFIYDITQSWPCSFHRYSYDIAIWHTVRCTWNMMSENWCKYTHDRTTMLPEIHNASIFYGTQSVTPDTSTSHMRLAGYSQTKEIHSPHLKHPQWFTGCSKKK